MADKMTNRPQLVKVEDLTRVPTKRKAALAAKKAIKDLVRYIYFTQETPTHAWRHEDWIDECLETDEEDEEEGERKTQPVPALASLQYPSLRYRSATVPPVKTSQEVDQSYLQDTQDRDLVYSLAH